VVVLGFLLKGGVSISLFSSFARRCAAFVPACRITKTIDSFKMRLDTTQFLDAKLLYLGRYEVDTVAAIKRLVRPGDVVVDVGANIGFLSLTLGAIVGSKGHVFAFEPSDWTFDRLNENLKLNPFSWITTKRAAVGDQDIPTLQMVLPCGYRLDGRDTATKQDVPFVKLDTVLSTCDRIDFIKTDTDGHEPAVIDGARSIIERFKPTILLEVAPDHTARSGQDLHGTFAYLKSLGYTFESNSGESVADPFAEAATLRKNGSYNIIAVNR
jgi:FkbM family methyltransferase